MVATILLVAEISNATLIAVRRHSPFRRRIAGARRFAKTACMRFASKAPPAAKRAFDAVTAATLLIAWSPLLLIMAVACRVSTGGMLRSVRVTGRHGKQFYLHRLAIPTRGWGRWARHFGGGGLPVLWHIARGEMSWIGPRPLPVDLPRPAGFSRRSGDRPGIISLAWLRRQANIDYDGEWESDQEYVETQSLKSDSGIALRAFWLWLLGCPARVLHDATNSSDVKLNVLGVPVRNVSMSQAVGELGDLLESDGPPAQVTFVNADCINLAQRDHAYRQCLHTADWNYPDGIGMKLAAQLQAAAIKQNVNGTDLFPRLLTRMEEQRASVFLFGGEPGIAEAVAVWINSHYPGVVVCGTQHGYIATSQENQDTISRINESGADLLLVARGAPRQDLWISNHLHQLDVRLAIGVGGLFDFYSGRRRRAPQWIRELGMEWAYRWWLEPRRLFKRYLIGNTVFLMRVVRNSFWPTCHDSDNSKLNDLLCALEAMPPAQARQGSRETHNHQQTLETNRNSEKVKNDEHTSN